MKSAKAFSFIRKARPKVLRRSIMAIGFGARVQHVAVNSSPFINFHGDLQYKNAHRLSLIEENYRAGGSSVLGSEIDGKIS